MTPAQPLPPGQGIWPSPIDDPYADQYTQPFWDAALNNQLLGYQCADCTTFIMPPQPFCFNCQSRNLTWVALPGTGTIYSYTVVRHPLGPHLQPVVPYISAVINLDGTQGAGARMLANIINCNPDTIHIGDNVQVTFDKISDTLAIPRFEPM